MKISLVNLLWAIAHPWKTFRYLKHHDRIPYHTIARYIPSDSVILEAGAADGKNTAEMADYWPQASIHAFEPVPDAMRLTEEHTQSIRDRVKLHPYALGSVPARLQMNVSGNGGADGTQSSSLLTPSGHLDEFENVSFKRKIEVDVVRLDDWAMREGIEKLDFLWLDLQGYELEALKGAERLLLKVSAIHVEVSHRQLYEGGVLYPELKHWLQQRGFNPVVNATFRLGGNVLFAR
jgi:FkbM family methyltransferase